MLKSAHGARSVPVVEGRWPDSTQWRSASMSPGNTSCASRSEASDLRGGAGGKHRARLGGTRYQRQRDGCAVRVALPLMDRRAWRRSIACRALAFQQCMWTGVSDAVPSSHRRGGTAMLNVDQFVADCRAALRQSTPELAVKEIVERAVASPSRSKPRSARLGRQDRRPPPRSRPHHPQRGLDAGHGGLPARPSHVGCDRALRRPRRQHVLSPEPRGATSRGRKAAGDRTRCGARTIDHPLGGEPAARVHRRDPHLRRRLLRHPAKRSGTGRPCRSSPSTSSARARCSRTRTSGGSPSAGERAEVGQRVTASSASLGLVPPRRPIRAGHGSSRDVEPIPRIDPRDREASDPRAPSPEKNFCTLWYASSGT